MNFVIYFNLGAQPSVRRDRGFIVTNSRPTKTDN